MLYGLAAALGFGLADTCAAISTRRIGVLATLFVIQLVDVLGLSVLLVTPLPGSIQTERAASVAIVVTGAFGTLAFFCFYRALQLGPVAIVSPVFASSAAIPVILSVVLIGERLSRLAGAGAALTLSGVVLASVTRGQGENRRVRGGIPYALAACVAWGVASFLIGRTSQEVGWFLPVYGSRAVQFVVVTAVVAWRRVDGTLPRMRARAAGVATIAAVADAAGVALFARGSEVGLVAIVSAVSSTFPLVVIAAGLTLFHERPTRVQWTGIVTTVLGLVVLGLGR